MLYKLEKGVKRFFPWTENTLRNPPLAFSYDSHEHTRDIPILLFYQNLHLPQSYWKIAICIASFKELQEDIVLIFFSFLPLTFPGDI